MIRPPRVQASRVLSLASTQIATLKGRPELEKGLLAPLSEIEALQAEVKVRMSAVEDLVKAANAAVQSLRGSVFTLSEVLQGNIELAGLTYGAASAEREALGGKPRNVERAPRKADAPATAAPTPGA